MSNHLKTIYHDLNALKHLLNYRDSTNFSAVLSYSLIRDACVILHEIHQVMKSQGIIEEETESMKKIEQIRHKVKTSQGKYNKSYFEFMLNIHRDIFGSDIDNIGFYFEEKILASSTIYSSFIFADTGLLPDNEGQKIYDFSVGIGATIATYLAVLEEYELELKYKENQVVEEKQYVNKDLWDKRLYTEDVQYNVFVTRLLLIQSELTVCLWLERKLNVRNEGFKFNQYILLRFISIKFFEIMRNLMDIQDRLASHWGRHSLNELDGLIKTYKRDLEDETLKLRNMLHYNPQGDNFYDYVVRKQQVHKDYAEDYINKLAADFIPKMRKQISESLDIQSYSSMRDFEQIFRRLATLTTKKLKLKK